MLPVSARQKKRSLFHEDKNQVRKLFNRPQKMGLFSDADKNEKCLSRFAFDRFSGCLIILFNLTGNYRFAASSDERRCAC